MLCDYDIEEYGLLLLCTSKWLNHMKVSALLQRDNHMKVSALLRAGHKVSEVANLVGLAQQSTRAKSAWTMAKMSIDVQVVVGRLLWIVTACGMTFEAVPRVVFRKLSRSTTVFRPLMTLLLSSMRFLIA